MAHSTQEKQREALRHVARAAAVNWIEKSQKSLNDQVKAIDDAGEVIPDINPVSDAMTRGLLAGQRLRERRARAVRANS